jgi:hypothetical protein
MNRLSPKPEHKQDKLKWLTLEVNSDSLRHPICCHTFHLVHRQAALKGRCANGESTEMIKRGCVSFSMGHAHSAMGSFDMIIDGQRLRRPAP